MSGVRGAYGKNKMRVTVETYRKTEMGNLRRLVTHVFVNEDNTRFEVFSKVERKFPNLELSEMKIRRIKSKEYRFPDSIF